MFRSISFQSMKANHSFAPCMPNISIYDFLTEVTSGIIAYQLKNYLVKCSGMPNVSLLALLLSCMMEGLSGFSFGGSDKELILLRTVGPEVW